MSKLGLLLSLVTLITVINELPASIYDSAWGNWNAQLINSGFTIPSLPSFSNYSVQRMPAPWFTRKQQYGYKLTTPPGGVPRTCKIICGPRSYLTQDANSTNYYCKRDTTSAYFGGQTNNGQPFATTCLPDVEECNPTYFGTDVLKNLFPGNCGPSSFTGAYAMNNGQTCCFKN